ncbi:thiol-dependent reductase 1 [Angomonas deanei]|nr:thiol-dependent reductase 1 [Angomonas deanei]|eukprot:EPY27379.1 thiol-dependent reductase 1 [Angomonas deanei]
MSGLKLFLNKCCPYCHKATIVAAEKNIPLEVVEVALGDAMPDWYKKINPNETVPTLQAANLCTGATTEKFIYESNLVAQYLDNIGAPAGSLMGATPYQRHKVEFFLSQVGDLVSAAYNLLRDPYNGERRQFLDDNIAYIENIIAETQLAGPFYLDERFSMADVVLLPFLARFKSVLPYYTGFDLFSKAPRMAKVYAAGMKRPSVTRDLLSPREYIAFYAKFVPKDFPALAAQGNYILYANKFCPFADRARLTCALKGIKPYYIETPIHPEAPWLKYINFRETVPVLVTPDGEIINESQLVVQYLDQVFPNQGPRLLPLGKADDEYDIQYFVTCAGNFFGAMYGFWQNNSSKEAKEELQWAANQLVKLLDVKPFGDGPFYGGKVPNAGDVSLISFLYRARVYHPERTGGYDVLADYPRLAALLDAALATEAGKAVYHPKEAYIARFNECGH